MIFDINQFDLLRKTSFASYSYLEQVWLVKMICSKCGEITGLRIPDNNMPDLSKSEREFRDNSFICIDCQVINILKIINESNK